MSAYPHSVNRAPGASVSRPVPAPSRAPAEQAPAEQAPAEQAPEEQAPSAPRWRRFLREHRLITAVLLAATIVRAIAMLAYPPALWFPDSLPYIQAALQRTPYSIRPVGYSFLLMLAEPAHSVMLVIALQHLMGVVVGALIYALLRRHRLPAWGSTLAAIPPLVSAYTIQIEHFALSDAFFVLLTTFAIALVLWRPRPRVWVCCAVGLLLAWAALDRSQGTLLIAPFVLYLAVARLGLRRFVVSAATMCMAFLIPVIGYGWWYHQSFGSYEITTSTGAFLYSRVAVFADCSVDRPPVDEQWLCLSTPVGQRQPGAWYVWSPQSPLARGPAAEFSSQVNHLATNFAVRAIIAQPAAYLRVVWDATTETFLPEQDTNKSEGQYVFPAAAPQSLGALAASTGEDPSYGLAYNGGANPSTRLVQPYAGWIQAYQRHVATPGPLLGAIVLVGLIGAALAWRRAGPASLAWLTGAVLIVTPAATADFDARYVVAAIPAFCIAAALGVREIDYRVRALREAW
jgi:hypothetical protein